MTLDRAQVNVVFINVVMVIGNTGCEIYIVAQALECGVAMRT